jgi:hypothetical protein
MKPSLYQEHDDRAKIQADIDQVQIIDDLLLGHSLGEKSVMDLGRIPYKYGLAVFYPFEHNE